MKNMEIRKMSQSCNSLNKFYGLVGWERGHRCHGLWYRGSRRIGKVSISSRADGGAKLGYHWRIDDTDESGTEQTLRTAKKKVERLSIQSLNVEMNYLAE